MDFSVEENRHIEKAEKPLSESELLLSAIVEEEKRQRQWLLKIGEYYYDNFAGLLAGDMEVLCDEVTASQMQVMQYKAMLRNLKDLIQCPNCGEDIEKTSVVCSACGVKVTEIL